MRIKLTIESGTADILQRVWNESGYRLDIF